jgi:hypothetical protein
LRHVGLKLTLDLKDKVELALLGRVGGDLSDAVPIAEAYGSGQAVSAGLDEQDGRLIFLVVVSDGSLLQVSLDPDEARSSLWSVSVGRKNRP